MMQIDIEILRREIAALLAEFPELNDDVDALDMSLSSETSLDEILTELARKFKHAQTYARALADEAKETLARKDRFELQAVAARRLAMAALNAADIRKRQVPLATFYISAGPQKVVGDGDPAKLPVQFQRVTIEANKTAIKEWLKSGQFIAGYELSNGQDQMNIRVK